MGGPAMSGAELSLVGGLHAVRALLKSNANGTQRLLVLKGRRDNRMRVVLDLAGRADIPVVEQSRRELDALAGDIEHQGVLAEYLGKAAGDEQDLIAHIAQLSEPALVLVLDGVQDPHNFGACLRSADAAGAHAVVVPLDNSVGVTPVVRKVACGAAETIALFQVTNLQRALHKLQDSGIWVYGAAGEAQASLFATDFTGPSAIVLGAEGRGLRRLTRETCDALFSIPMQGSVESLNVSVANGISLFEARRQRSDSAS